MAFHIHRGVCGELKPGKYSGCGKDGWIRTTRGLCDYCEQDRKQELKADKEPKTPKAKKEKTILKLFIEIWNERLLGDQFERPNDLDSYTLDQYVELVSEYRVCFITLTPVKHFFINCFSHVCTKNYVNLREQKKNIVLKQAYIHHIWEFGDRTELEKHPGYKYLLELKGRLVLEDYELMRPLYRKK